MVLCGVLLIAGLPVFVQATVTTENEVSLEEFTNQLSDIIEKYDIDTVVAEEKVNSVSSFSVCADGVDVINMSLEFILDDDVPQTPTPVLSVDSCDFDEDFYLEMTCFDPDAYILYTFSTRTPSTVVRNYE